MTLAAKSYYRTRAEQEREAANNATNLHAAEIHLELASQYEALAEPVVLGPTGRMLRSPPMSIGVRPTTDTIERAFQLAGECANVAEIRAKLKREGYTSVDAHLSGAQLRANLTRICRRHI